MGTNQMDKADQYIDRVKDLPPAPTVATQLLGLFGDPDRDVDRIVELIGHDPSLTAEVLRRCNSALFRGDEAVTGMFEAVMRLGFYEVYCVVSALVGARAMSMGKAKGGLDMGSLWRHTVVTAVAASTLAKGDQEAEALAFTAGLLHDIGKLVLSSVESARYAGLVQQSGAFGQSLADAEQAAFGVNHAVVGARLLTRWGLPENVATSVLLHHSSIESAGPHAELAARVNVANALAHRLIDQTAETPVLLSCSPDAMILLEVSADDVPVLLERTKTGLQRVESLLNMAI
ncbi:MAG TPA: HDOD domain-containing protein [Verrucomicrobiae bacterium]|nr:HDOD domain-containing protein [Verrucomicrobiae bacterium]